MSNGNNLLHELAKPITSRIENVISGPQWIENALYVNLIINMILLFAIAYITYLIIIWMRKVNEIVLKGAGVIDKEPDLLHSIYFVSEIEKSGKLNILDESSIKFDGGDVVGSNGGINRFLKKTFKLPFKGFYIVSYRVSYAVNGVVPNVYVKYDGAVSLENGTNVNNVNGNKIAHQTGTIMITDPTKPFEIFMVEGNGHMGGYIRIFYLGKISKNVEKYRRDKHVF